MSNSVAYSLFPPIEPRCEEHMDRTCWQCEGTGCLVEHPETVECLGCCDVCEGRGCGSWCFHPDCEDCRTVHLFREDVCHRGDVRREACR